MNENGWRGWKEDWPLALLLAASYGPVLGLIGFLIWWFI